MDLTAVVVQVIAVISAGGMLTLSSLQMYIEYTINAYRAAHNDGASIADGPPQQSMVRNPPPPRTGAGVGAGGAAPVPPTATGTPIIRGYAAPPVVLDTANPTAPAPALAGAAARPPLVPAVSGETNGAATEMQPPQLNYAVSSADAMNTTGSAVPRTGTDKLTVTIAAVGVDTAPTPATNDTPRMAKAGTGLLTVGGPLPPPSASAAAQSLADGAGGGAGGGGGVVPADNRGREMNRSNTAAHVPRAKSVERYSLPWWFHRMALLISISLSIEAMDPAGINGHMPGGVVYANQSLFLLYACSGLSLWLYFTVRFLYRQVHRDISLELSVAILSIPVGFTTTVIFFSVTPVLATGHYVWIIPGQVAFVVSDIATCAAAAIAYFKVRGVLTRFLASVNQPKAAAGTGANATPSTQFDTKHIIDGLRTLRNFILVAEVILGVGWIISLVGLIPTFEKAIADPYQPVPPYTLSEITASILALFIAGHLVGWLHIWYCYVPYSTLATLSPVAGAGTDAAGNRVVRLTPQNASKIGGSKVGAGGGSANNNKTGVNVASPIPKSSPTPGAFVPA